MPGDCDAVEAFVQSLPPQRALELEGGTNAVRLLAPRAPFEVVHRVLCQMTCNSMTLAPEAQVRAATSSGRSGCWKDFGVGLFPSGAILNHSCAPSCLWFVRGGVLVVETVRPVAKGEELTIQYLPVTGNLTERRRRIREGFGFHCVCRRCHSEEQADAASDTKRGGRASAKARAKARGQSKVEAKATAKAKAKAKAFVAEVRKRPAAVTAAKAAR